MKEIWRHVPGYPLYAVSTLGRIKSLEKTTVSVSGIRRKWPEKILKPQPTNREYLRIGLRNSDGRKSFLVHRLVLLAFVGKPKSNYVCNHLNCDPTDNRLENLEWTTQSENQRYARRLGRQTSMPPHKFGETHGHAKLSETQAIEILSSNKRLCDLARYYGVSRCTIGDIKEGRTWKHLNELRVSSIAK